MTSIEEFHGYGLDLFQKLHLSTYPVGIKYIRSAQEIPEEAIRHQVYRLCLRPAPQGELRARFSIDLLRRGSNNAYHPRVEL